MDTTRRLITIASVAVALVGLYGTAAGANGGRQGNTPGVFGTVTAIGTDTTQGDCGTTGATGTFTVTAYDSSTAWTVDVNGSTSSAPTVFNEPGVSGASFANVCVGADVGAVGTVDTSDSTVTAATVFVAPATPPTMPHHLYGTVTAIGTDTTEGDCGTTGATGTFTLATWRKSTSWTVDVNGSTSSAPTAFNEPGVSGASFANVCVGSSVGVRGALDSATSTVTATGVFIAPPPHSVFGQVTAIGTDTTAGDCGMTGATGTFTLTTYRSSTAWTVDVSGSTSSGPTTFVMPGNSSASFANVCVGEWAGAAGTLNPGSSPTVNPTTTVFVAPVVAPPPTPRGVFGTVTAIGTDTTTGDCGSAGGSGSFTVTTWQQSTPWTVDVSTSSPTTTFSEPGTSGATFADVCVGGLVAAQGSVDASTYTVTASLVLIAPAATWSATGGSGGTGGFSWDGGRGGSGWDWGRF